MRILESNTTCTLFWFVKKERSQQVEALACMSSLDIIILQVCLPGPKIHNSRTDAFLEWRTHALNSNFPPESKLMHTHFNSL